MLVDHVPNRAMAGPTIVTRAASASNGLDGTCTSLNGNLDLVLRNGAANANEHLP
jgi:hypothetical protein